MKKHKVEIEFRHYCNMNEDTGLGPGGRKWNLHFYRYNTAEMMGQDYYITALFLICICGAFEVGMFSILKWWWLWIQIAIASIAIYLFVKSDIKYKARVNRFAYRMNKKYGVPTEQAIEYWYKNQEYLS